MKSRIFLLSMAVLLSFNFGILVQEGHNHSENKGSMMGHMKEEASDAVEVGNKICPVSGETVEDVGGVYKQEHDGKVYNFCCAGCAKEFEKDLGKYIKNI